jgi:hypothetical protein
MKHQQKLHYVCTAQIVEDENGRPRKAYRFNVLDLSGERPRVVAIVNDICSNDEEAHELEQLFRRNQVSANHIMDVLEDWVAYRG